MVAMAQPVIDLTARYPDGRIPAPEVQRAAGISRGALRYAVNDGLVTPVGTHQTGHRGRPAAVFAVEDVMFLVACAALALAAGVAFAAMARALRSTGARVDPAALAVVVPLPTP